MTFVRPQFSIPALSLVVALTAACGGGSATLSPAAPSGVGGGATISGQVSGVTISPLSTNAFGTLETRGVTVTVVGTGISTTADNTGQFTLTNVPAGTVQLNFTGPGSSATVTIAGVGPNDRVQISVTVNGNNARVDREQHSAPDANKREFQGRITSVNAAARTFEMSGMTVKAPADAVIRHGGRTVAFADLKVGDHVEVRGAKDGTTVTATEIKVETDDEDDDAAGANQPEFKGSITAVNATARSFEMSGMTVNVPAAVVIRRGNTTIQFTDLKVGDQVEVRGTKVGTTVTATEVKVEDAAAAPGVNANEFEGRITSINTTARSFEMAGMTVNVPAAAVIRNGKKTIQFADLKVGDKVEVRGTKAGTTVTATDVKVDNEND